MLAINFTSGKDNNRYKRFVSIFVIFALLMLLSASQNVLAAGKTLYIDISKGNDATADGSQAKPYKTFDKALNALQSGDTLLVNNGNYGDVVFGRTPGLDWGNPDEITVPYSKFTSWTTVKAAPGQQPHFNTLQIGTLNIPNSGSPSKTIDFSQKGNCDVYMSVEGMYIDDGAFIAGSRYVKIKGCTINRQGELNGNANNLDNKTGLEVVNGRYITLENNDITHVAIGIAAASYDIVIKNNEIHHNSHDGMRILGGSDFLVEGNRIHDLDDGYEDNVDWARHSDGIHLFDLFDVTNNLTIRGNLLYHIECMGFMIQGGDGSVKNKNWVIENNIFGPIGSIVVHLGADIYDGCIIRHNTVVMAPNDTWTSIYNRTMTSKAYHLALWSVDAVNKGYKVYNNIFTDDTPVPSEYGYASNNIFYDASSLPFEAIPGNIADYLASGKIPGTLKSGSSAINKGSTLYAAETPTDFNGKTRDQNPDIGAIEYGGVSTPGTPSTYSVTGGKTLCSGQTTTIGLGGSETGVTYQLYKGTATVGSPVTGTGSALTIGTVSESGTFTVYGTNTSSNIKVLMSGSAIVTVQPIPTAYTVSGGGTGCSGESFSIKLSGSQSTLSYQLYLGTTASGTAITGTGNPLDFGKKSDVGTYTVKASNNGCVQNMTGSAIIASKSGATKYQVTGGGTGCAGESYNIGLTGSQSTISYQLYLDGTASGTAITGTGNPLDFGKKNTSGVYTIKTTSAECIETMTGSATITLKPLPTQFQISGGGTGCSGESFNIKLNGSQSAVSYQLYLEGTTSGTAVTGTGSALDFGKKSGVGTYTIKASNGGCIQNMTGSASIVLKPGATKYQVTGGGTGCSGESYSIGLSGSQSATSYQLYIDGTASGTAIAGTGTALDFGKKNTTGTYTIKTSGAECIQTMTGSATITLKPLPTAYQITGGGAVCEGETIGVGLSGSQSSVSYQLYSNGAVFGNAVIGTGNAISFGTKNTVGTYTVKASNGGCSQTMTGSVAVTLKAGPAKYQVTGGGTGCEGESFGIGLNNSQNNASYQLYLNNNAIGNSKTGNGQPLNFGNQSERGAYTVIATLNGCKQNMTGSQTITINPNPVVYQVIGGGIINPGDSGIIIGLSDSDPAVTYKLRLDTVVINTLTGTGSPLFFNKQNTEGDYNVVALTNKSCFAQMGGIANININEGSETETNNVINLPKIYPNPAIDHFTIKFNEPLKESRIIEVYNSNGVKLYNQNLFQGEQEKRIDHNWPKGSYLVKIYPKTIVLKMSVL